VESRKGPCCQAYLTLNIVYGISIVNSEAQLAIFGIVTQPHLSFKFDPWTLILGTGPLISISGQLQTSGSAQTVFPVGRPWSRAPEAPYYQMPQNIGASHLQFSMPLLVGSVLNAAGVRWRPSG
jgi:hypothetical protein